MHVLCLGNLKVIGGTGVLNRGGQEIHVQVEERAAFFQRADVGLGQRVRVSDVRVDERDEVLSCFEGTADEKPAVVAHGGGVVVVGRQLGFAEGRERGEIANGALGRCIGGRREIECDEKGGENGETEMHGIGSHVL